MKPVKNSPLKSERGSVLVVAMILGIGITLAIGSFIALTVDSSKLSQRSFHANSCVNLAEAGLEEAIYALNNSDWTGWGVHSSGGSNRVKVINNFDLGQGMTGQVVVVVYGATSNPTPTIVSEGKAFASIGPPIVKQLEVKVKRKSLFAGGLVAKDTVSFSGGNASVDSYVSNDPTYSTSGLYDASKRNDKGTVGSASLDTTQDGVSISNSDIWGYVSTANGNMPSVGPNGTIKGADTPGGVDVDINRITTDYSSSFQNISDVPTSFDVVLGNLAGNSNHTLGTAGTATVIQAANIDNNNGRVITISGDVTLVVTNSIDIKGDFIVATNSSLTLYLGGDMDVGGNGIANTDGLPEDFIIYGTNTTVGGQLIKLHGNGAVNAAIYAPNATVELKGGGSSGSMSGSVVANDIKVTGNYEFHYDEALEELGGGNPFAVGSWRELVSAADRIALY
jgi:hypothetical protein